MVTVDGEGSDVGCRVNDVFQLLSRAHMLDVLHLFTQVADEPLRFKDLEAELEISPNTLSQRLKELVAAGLLDRRSYDEIPPRVEYEATEKAQDLCEVFDCMHAWAEKHDLERRPSGRKQHS